MNHLTTLQRDIARKFKGFICQEMGRTNSSEIAMRLEPWISEIGSLLGASQREFLREVGYTTFYDPAMQDRIKLVPFDRGDTIIIRGTDAAYGIRTEDVVVQCSVNSLTTFRGHTYTRLPSGNWMAENEEVTIKLVGDY